MYINKINPQTQMTVKKPRDALYKNPYNTPKQNAF